ncbi:replicative DNA helicase [Bacillus suaedaesalsae]|nr:DnaB-like helicase C-terminal domain-containing protein [Bacillus suaedaesalsae]
MAEKTYLGCLMKADYLIKDTIIQPQQLESTIHQEIMRSMLELSQKGKNTDLITLSTLPILSSIGGVSYLAELQSYAEVEKFDELEEIIMDSWKEREKRNILKIAGLNDWEIARVITELDKINQVTLNDHSSIQDSLLAVYHSPWEDQEEVKTATTGIQSLDTLTGGFQDGEVTIVAARPSMGKTDVMLHFAKAAGWTGYIPVIFSLEMPEKLITSRLIASTGSYNRTKLRNPKKMLNDQQKNKWAEVIGNISETNIQIFDAAGQRVSEMRAKTRKIMHQFPNKKPIILIDYLTLIQANQQYAGNSHNQVTEISRNLKTMAKDLNCPVVCLAQLNRSVESRSNKRPMMSDIRESGSVEQDADVILFLYRDQYYDKKSNDPSLEIIVSKNRNGPVGNIKVKYNVHTGLIESFTENELAEIGN